jgi:hypothetical protein
MHYTEQNVYAVESFQVELPCRSCTLIYLVFINGGEHAIRKALIHKVK